MCGILGQIRTSNCSVKLSSSVDFKSALDLMIHRGPDDSDTLSTENYQYGHRRLSIIDLDPHAKQPMTTADGSMTITFNGEIFNYRELAIELVAKGYIFRTKSDTEVLLYGIQNQGIAFISKCIGMFALAVYDKLNRKHFLVRDRLGVKPLYYHIQNGLISFSSEIKSILRLSDKDFELNLEAISSYLSFRYPVREDTFFKGIYSLPPGHVLEIPHEAKTRIIEYWNPVSHFNEQQNDRGEAYYLEQLENTLISSVKYRMIADVPVGAYLSGGVDSSLVVALMTKQTGPNVKTFTIGFDEPGYNEFNYARIVADKYQTDHHEIILKGSNYLHTMEQLIGYKDAPLSVPNEVPLFEMSKELKNHITVVLSGEGADEIFGGYGRIFRSCYDLYRSLHSYKSLLSKEDQNIFTNNFAAKYGKSAFCSEIDHFLNIYSYTSKSEKSNLLSPDFNINAMESVLSSYFESWFNKLQSDTYENKMMYTFERVHLLGLLQRVDMTTMATSVEARVPFVDHRLVEFAFQIPFKYKLKWNSQQSIASSQTLMSDKISEVHDTPKYILKKLSEKYLPTEVIYRKKMGFPVPLNSWFGGEFNSYAREQLMSQKARGRGIYNLHTIESWLGNDSVMSNHANAMKIWMLINIELFLQRYFDK